METLKYSTVHSLHTNLSDKQMDTHTSAGAGK